VPAALALRAVLLVTIVLAVAVAACASATPARRDPPREGYQLHDKREVGALTVERWVPTASPEVSPAGMCECITVVYLGDRKLLALGEPNEMTATSIDNVSGTDINGDARPEIVVSTWSGGAHCCYSTSIYSIGDDVRPVLTIETGNCGPGEIRDLDGDQQMEVVTCDDRWGYTYCSFADSPFPQVVYTYNSARREYELATPRFASRFRDDIATKTTEARTHMAAEGGKDAGIDKCTVLRPALALMYLGRLEDGRQLIRELYRGADLDTFEKEVSDGAQASRLWVAR
jgi:hypothetical protein